MNLNDFKMGYVLAYKSTGSLFNRLIVKRQLAAGFAEEQAQYVHVEISGGERHSIDISPPISKLIDITKVHRGRYVKVLKLNTDDFYMKRYKVAYFSASLCNKVYDFSGVLSFLLKWITHNNRLYFCSEGVAWAFNMVYNKLFLEPNKVMPANYLTSAHFETVWEGIIEEAKET